MKTKKLAALLLTGALATSMLTGCGIGKNAVVATYDDGEVTLGLVKFMCRYNEAECDDAYIQSLGEDLWNTDPYSSGTTLGENMKESIMDTVHEMYTLQNHMSDYNVSLTDDEKKAITEAAEGFMEANSKKTLKAMGATEAIVEEYLTLTTIKSKMYDAIIADADTNVSDADANMRAYTLLEIDLDGSYDSSYNFTDYTDEEVTALKETAKSIYAAIDEPANFDAVAESYGYSVTTGTYDADDDSLDEDLKTAMDKTKEGKLTNLITTDTDCFIARIDAETDEEATEQNKTDIVEERKTTLYDETLEKWQEDDNWKVKSSVLAKITFKDIFTQESETESADSTEGSETVVEETTEN